MHPPGTDWRALLLEARDVEAQTERLWGRARALTARAVALRERAGRAMREALVREGGLAGL